MDLFYNFNMKNTVNISKIRKIDVARKNAVHITFDNGDTDIHSTSLEAETAIEIFGKTIGRICRGIYAIA